jgi:hypothetical protein
MKFSKKLYYALVEKYDVEFMEVEKNLLMYFRRADETEIDEEFLTEVDTNLVKFTEIINKVEKFKEFLKFNNIEYGN